MPATGVPVAANLSACRSTAQATLAGLLAKATTRHCDERDLRVLSPIGRAACRARPQGSAARAPWISCLRRYLLPRLLLRLAAGGEPTRNQAKPCGEIAAAVKAFRPTDGRDKGGRQAPALCESDPIEPGCCKVEHRYCH